jgi:hypothetical protein
MTTRFKGVPNLPFAPFLAVLSGLVAAVLISQTPNWMLEKLVSGLGIAALIPAAAPPLGDTARALLSVVTGLLVAVPLWLVLRVVERKIHTGRMEKARGSRIQPESVPEAPVGETRRRRPILAGAELGAPLMSDEALSKGEELLLSEDAVHAPYAAPASRVGASRPPLEDTLLDLSSWNAEAPAEVMPEPAPVEVFAEEAPIALSPLPAHPIEEAATDWDSIAPIRAPVRTDAFNIGHVNIPSVQAEEVETDVSGDDNWDQPDDVHAPVTFETVPLESLLDKPEAVYDAEPAPAPEPFVPEVASLPPSSERPRDILDSASFLTPRDFEDDFVGSPLNIERTLSVDSFQQPAAALPEIPPVRGVELPQQAEIDPWDVPVPPQIATPPEAEYGPEAGPEAGPAEPAPMIADVAADEEDESLIDLLDRLESALARRAASSPQPIPAPTNLTALRDMLQQGQRVANW